MRIYMKIVSKKVFCLFIICFFFISGIVNVVNGYGYFTEKIEIETNNEITYQIFDEIDQQQNNYNASTCLLGSILFAQSFKPTLETLTRVKLLMNKFGNLYGNSILSIRESLTGNDLTSVSKESLEINYDFEWIEFDFPDIQVTPGDSYYIILNPDPDSDGGDGFNYISWAFAWTDLYPKGSPFLKYNGSWSEGIPGQSSADYTFITYGSSEDNVEDVQISISAGSFGLDFGFGITINVLNYRNEVITIDYGYIRDKYFINDFPMKHSSDFDVPAEQAWFKSIGIGDNSRIYQISLYASFENINVTRSGITIGKLVVLQ